MHDFLRSARHVLVINVFANKSTLVFLKAYHDEDIHIVNNGYQPHIGETVEFIYDLNSEAEARALVKKAFKLTKPDNLPVRAHAYYGDMDRKQRQKDFSDINIAWSKLNCIAYTNTVEAGISFKVTGHFDIVIAITNIATSVYVEAFAQMLYRIRDCPRCVIFLFYQKNSNELFCLPGRENIQAELASAQSNNLPTAIKGHYEWDNNTISYKIDESLAVTTFIEVEHQKHLFARYFIEKLCSLIAIHNKVRVEALVIKKTDFNAVATFQNLDPEEAKNFKFDQEHSIPDTMALKCCKTFQSTQTSETFFAEDSHYKARYNSEKSVAEDLHKLYSANYWKVIRKLFQILGFTSIDDKYILFSNIVLETFTQFCERFIEALDQSLLLFRFKSHAKITSDLNLTIRAINAIARNWCGYTVKINRKKIGSKEKQKAHKDVKEAHYWCLFKENQIGALVPNNKKKRLTIKERAQYCVKTKDVWDIWLHALDLAVPKNNTDEAIMTASSHVS
ncbi:12721_t:CDS:2 [Cetraspora pellucida]|uniref:12721_t:CDS:1 n=1 Tax=Cetraspora pellucida TaxID=1433469 RepID=A0ACA9MGM4_9GLOM|nr:12721_t:CDS:2 [Cetraspora pellucida]